MGHSTPAARCFKHAWQEALDRVQKQTTGHIGSGTDTFAMHFEYERAHDELCSQHGQKTIHAHIVTGSATRDMLHVVDKADEERHRRNQMSARGRPCRVMRRTDGSSSLASHRVVRILGCA